MSSFWQGKRILLGVTGGVAVYKSVGMVSKLVQAGAEVDVVMTPGAMEFVQPLLFASITHRTVYHNPWQAERRPEHIALAERPDLIVVAPCTANTMAKLAYGIADNLLTGVLLCTKKPVLLAPAMNCGMWTAAATQRNVRILQADGYHFVGPETGNLACGDVGIGRMAEPEGILAAMEEVLEGEERKRVC